MRLKERAGIGYKKFSLKEGNMHIAKQFSIQIVLELITNFKINNVLELGLGIGSICDTVLSFSEEKNKIIIYSGTENNDYCLNALKTNVDKYNDLIIFSELEDIPSTNKFDLIIIDGSDKSLSSINKYTKRNSLIFVENGREDQVLALKHYFPDLLVVRISSDYKSVIDGPYDKNSWSGGGTLMGLYPDMKFKIYWFKQKTRTFLNLRKRRLLR